AAKSRPAARPTVLAVARMYPRKHLDDLIIAAARLRTRIAALQVRIVGDGPESLRLRALVARHGLGDTVVFLGQVARSTLAVEYGRAHCFCLPSVQEGFGIVFAEAMAAGLPIVACRAAAVPEVVADGRVGLLVAPRSPDEVATALETLLSDARLRREMGEEGRRRVETFDLVPVARSFLEALPALARLATALAAFRSPPAIDTGWTVGQRRRTSASLDASRFRTATTTRSTSPSVGRSTNAPAW